MNTEHYDAIVVGAGPNGLTAAAVLAAHGAKTLVLEASETIGGGTRTAEATLPGYLHDTCSAVHPTGFLSPIFRALRLENEGLEWIHPHSSAAHPLDGGEVVMLETSIESTAAQLGMDGDWYRDLAQSLTPRLDDLLAAVLQPGSLPKDLVGLARFGLRGLLPATTYAKMLREPQTRALFAGCAAHSILPFEFLGTTAVGLIFLLTAHTQSWPIAKGGSQSISNALASFLQKRGGSIRCGEPVRHLADLPPARVYLFDTSPAQLAEIAGDALPGSYRKRLERYQYGPGVFKIDYALSQPIPWTNVQCQGASTVHVGGTFEEIAASERAAWHGQSTDQPFVMVCQQSHFDTSRAPTGKHTGYAYCHVPNGSQRDMKAAMEDQIERFAPGFRDCILATRCLNAADLQRYNPSYQGGAITGGAARLSQMLTRPVARLDPYSTPNPSLFLCSHATPPGGGVHGMCGLNASRSALRRLGLKFDDARLR